MTGCGIALDSTLRGKTLLIKPIFFKEEFNSYYTC